MFSSLHLLFMVLITMIATTDLFWSQFVFYSSPEPMRRVAIQKDVHLLFEVSQMSVKLSV